MGVGQPLNKSVIQFMLSSLPLAVIPSGPSWKEEGGKLQLKVGSLHCPAGQALTLSSSEFTQPTGAENTDTCIFV